MIFYPTICIDNFFEHPEHIRNYILTNRNNDKFKWKPSATGRWPGIRSCGLGEINYSLFQEIATRYLLNHYSAEQLAKVDYQCKMMFQIIKEEDVQGGWVHSDYPKLHTSIVYLTPNASLDSGTNIYQIKDSTSLVGHHSTKLKVHKNNVYNPQSEEFRLKYNSQFNKTMTFSNIYNRCIGFDGNMFHCANDFDKKEERLTLVMFWEKINGPMTNLQISQSLPQGHSK